MKLYFKYVLACCLAAMLFETCCYASDTILHKNISLKLQPHTVFGKDGKSVLFLSEPWQEIDLSRNDFRDDGISNKCMAHLKDFSLVTSKFINCAVTNSRPLHYCENCVSEYVSVQNAFQIISTNSNNPSTNCREQILRADTIQLALVTNHFVETIWETSDCAKCFDAPISNTSQPTAMTKTLLQKIDDTLNCFNDFSFLNKNDSSRSNNSVCGKCKDLYCDANEYYENVENQKMLCSDLIDSMNYTRLAWAQKYHCTIALRDKGVIWVITAIVCVLPFILYIGLVFYDRRYVARNRGLEESYSQDLDGSD